MRSPIEDRTYFAGFWKLKRVKQETLVQALMKMPGYLNELIDAGNYIACGDWTSHDGGLILFRAPDIKEAKKVAKKFPLNDPKYATFELFEWPARWAFGNALGMTTARKGNRSAEARHLKIKAEKLARRREGFVVLRRGGKAKKK